MMTEVLEETHKAQNAAGAREGLCCRLKGTAGVIDGSKTSAPLKSGPTRVAVGVEADQGSTQN